MKATAFIFSFVSFFISCSGRLTNREEPSSGELIRADRDFNAFCKAHGRSAAFIAFAGDSVIQMREGAAPLRGFQQLSDFYRSKNDTSSNLSWEPEKAEVSGELGYTFGWWKFKAHTPAGADTVLHGNYVTVWKKQKNGSWKYVLDGGNNTPDPLR